MVTISDVAARAGVSRTTVSHTINRSDRVSEGMRVRVQEAIDELGYVPNTQAKSLRTGKTNIIALLVPDILNPTFTEIIHAAQRSLEGFGKDVMLYHFDVPGGHSIERTHQYLSEIRKKGVDGLIMGDVGLPGMYDAIGDIPIPSVFIGVLPNRKVDNVRAGDREANSLMARYLVERGHKRIALVAGPSAYNSATARAAGFQQGAREAGLPPEALIRFEGSYLAPSGEAAVRWLMKEHRADPPTVVHFSNYLMAMGGIAALQDHGLRIPDDIAVTVYGREHVVSYVRPRLTRIGTPPSALAQRAVDLLMDRLEGGFAGPARSVVIDAQMQIGDSA